MSRYLKPLLLASLVLATPLAYADDEDGQPTPRVTNTLYYGVGLFDDMSNVNVEYVSPWGNFIVRAGRFYGVEGLAANMSWRKPLDSDDGNSTGFYIGAFGGHIAAVNIAEHGYERLGLGGEMSYQWVSEYTRKELAVGLGAAEPLKVGNTEYSADPSIYVSFSVSLGY